MLSISHNLVKNVTLEQPESGFSQLGLAGTLALNFEHLLILLICLEVKDIAQKPFKYMHFKVVLQH